MIRADRPTLERNRFAKLAAALAVSSAAMFATAYAHAEKVGVAAAVNPDAFSSLSGAPQSQINIGKSIFYKERINTTGSGLVQVLLVDGSTFTVGPGSDLVIDKFVYNPKKGTGEISASFSKGVMRFVGGKLSKNDGGVTVDTPAGVLAIRGGIAYLDFKSAKSYSILFVFGDYLKNLSSNKTLFEKGYGWFMDNGQVQTRPFTTADLKNILVALTNNSGGYGGKPPDPPKPNEVSELYTTQSLNQMVVNATTESILTQAREAANDQPDTQSPLTCQQLGNCPPPPTCEELGNCPPPPTCEELGNCPPPPTCEELGNCPPPPDDETDNSPNPGGYAAGVVVSDQPQKGFKNLVRTDPPADFLAAAMVFYDVQNHDPATSRYELSFGDNSAAVFNQSGVAYTQVSATGQQLLNLPPLCEYCAFFSWGSFSTEISFSNGPGTTQYIDQIDGYWVSGDLASSADIAALEKLGATATYSGFALGNVIRGNDGLTYSASGDLFMEWNFGTRSGALQISNFDASFQGGLSFGGDLTQIPNGANQFSGSLSGSGLTGGATGSFVRGPNSPIDGVIGNWDVSKSGYRATGIFAGTQPPGTH